MCTCVCVLWGGREEEIKSITLKKSQRVSREGESVSCLASALHRMLGGRERERERTHWSAARLPAAGGAHPSGERGNRHSPHTAHELGSAPLICITEQVPFQMTQYRGGQK